MMMPISVNMERQGEIRERARASELGKNILYLGKWDHCATTLHLVIMQTGSLYVKSRNSLGPPKKS